MQARFETPTKARSTGHTPKPLVVGNGASIVSSIKELNISPPEPLSTPSRDGCCGQNGINGRHDVYPCPLARNFQQPVHNGIKHPIFDLAHGPQNSFSGPSALEDCTENLGNLFQPNLRNREVLTEIKSINGHIDPFIVGNRPAKPNFSNAKNNDGYDLFLSGDDDSDDSAKTLKSPAGIALPSSPACFSNKAGNTISGENAQSYYTPESCIFVANLPMAYSDNQLQTEIQSIYGAFGECYVKVRRDSQGMPYAFVQYTKPTSAEDAIEKGTNLLVGGRTCRVEPAKVPRTVFLFKANGNSLSIEQANEFLKTFGPIQKAWKPSDTEQEMFGLPSGVFIRFMYYDHCQEALEKTRNDKTFHLQRKDDLAKTSNPRSFVRNAQVDHNAAHHGSNAIWIGSIQGDWASVQVLRNFYGRRVGSVSGAFVGAGSFGEKQSKYALVWFHDRNAVSKAVECDTSELNAFNGGVPLRVQRKRSKPQTPEKRLGNIQTSPDGKFIRSPYNGGPVSHPMFISPNMTPEQGRNFAYIHPMFPGVHPAYPTMQSPGIPYPTFNGHFAAQQNGIPNGYSPNNFSASNESQAVRSFQDGFEALALPRPEPMPLHSGYLDRRF